MAGAGRSAPYRLGDWFLVPLADGRVAPGRVARNPALHVTLSYIFSPVEPPVGLEEVRQYEPGDAIAAVRVSGLSIADEWRLLGGHEDFDPRAWPIPELEDADPLRPGRLEAWRLDERLRVVERNVVPFGEVGRRQPAGSMGAVFLEQWLVIQLEKGALRPVREQIWWPGDDPTSRPVASSTVAEAPVAPPSKVVVVLPGPEAVWDVEDLLRERLPARYGEVDGNLMSPDGAEILVYTNHPARTARRIARLLAGRDLPRGAHLRRETDGGDPVIIPLAPL